MLSDCEKCWDTPCLCGHNYRHLSSKDILDIVEALVNIVAKRNNEGEEQPNWIDSCLSD